MPLNRRTLLIGASTAPFLSLLPKSALAAQPPIYSERGIAIDGTDAVAYFSDGAPVEGSSAHEFDWKGTTWRFSSADNRDTFAADPEAYAPQYGGYCAYAVSEGTTASTVPHAWKIVDGKLYLNYSRRFHRKWERDIPGRIASADANWPAVLG